MNSLIGNENAGFVIVAQKPVCFAPGDEEAAGIVVLGFKSRVGSYITDEWVVWIHQHGAYITGEYFYTWAEALSRFNGRNY